MLVKEDAGKCPVLLGFVMLAFVVKGVVFMKCKKCNYEWVSRIENPKSCPRCKARLDI